MAHPTISVVVKAKLHRETKAATDLSELVVVGGGGDNPKNTLLAHLAEGPGRKRNLNLAL